MRWIVVIAVAVACAIGACTLLEDDPPPNTCKVDTDCFRTSERCDPTAHVCVAKPDAGIDAP